MILMGEVYESSIVSVTHDLNRKLFLDYMLGREFILRHDLAGSGTSIITSEEGVREINRSL